MSEFGNRQVPLDVILVPDDRLRRLQEPVIEQLAESMRARGLLQPILIRLERHDAKRDRVILIGGLHRLHAARQLGWKEIAARVLDDADATAAELAEIDENLIRAELSPAERALHIARRKAIYEQQHPETRNGATGRGRGKVCQVGTAIAGAFIDDTAGKRGKGRTTISRDARRAASIPSLRDVIGTSLDKGEELDALTALPAGEQERLIARACEGERVSAKGAAKRVKRDQKERALAARTRAVQADLGIGRYSVIYADPPWRWEPRSRETGMDRAADNHYPTMPTAAIGALKVPAADDCVLFLWATAPMLPDALAVMQAWGFSYRSHCIWKKSRIGTGYWFRSAHEMLLVGIKGSIPAPAPGQQFASVIEAPTGVHSVKPPAVAEMIEEMFPTLPRVELFAREKRRGWEAWGNEVMEASEPAGGPSSPARLCLP